MTRKSFTCEGSWGCLSSRSSGNISARHYTKLRSKARSESGQESPHYVVSNRARRTSRRREESLLSVDAESDGESDDQSNEEYPVEKIGTVKLNNGRWIGAVTWNDGSVTEEPWEEVCDTVAAEEYERRHDCDALSGG